MDSNPSFYLRNLIWFGVLPFPLISIVVIYAGTQVQDYSHFSQFMSELGAEGNLTHSIYNYVGILPSSLFVLLAGIGIASILPASNWQRLTLATFCFVAIGYAFAGAFPCDIGCPPDSQSLNQVIHAYSAGYAHLLFILLPLIVAKAHLATRSLTYKISILSTVFAGVANFGVFGSYPGLFQRVSIGILLLWLATLCWLFATKEYP